MYVHSASMCSYSSSVRCSNLGELGCLSPKMITYQTEAVPAELYSVNLDACMNCSWLVEAVQWTPQDIPQDLLLECPALTAFKVSNSQQQAQTLSMLN